MEEKKQNKIEEITEKLKAGMKDMFTSENFKKYLKTMSKFTNYSYNNSLLIAMQRPDATYVAGYSAWKNQFERQVVKGSKGIQIIQPTIYMKKVPVEVKDINGNNISGSDGKVITEFEEKPIHGFKIGYVYAYEDTVGTPLPSIITEVNADVDGYKPFLDTLVNNSTFPVVLESIDSNLKGFYDLNDRIIHIQDNLSELQTIKTLLHEEAHAIMHDRVAGTDQKTSRREREVEAEAVAYTVCSYYGLDTSDYSFGYIGSWAESMELKELHEHMDMIRKTSNQIIDSVDRILLDQKCKNEDELCYKNNGGYLHIQRSEDGYDFSYYDKNYIRVDGGQLANAGMDIVSAAKKAMMKMNINPSFMTLYNTEYLLKSTENVNGIKNNNDSSIPNITIIPPPSLVIPHKQRL